MATRRATLDAERVEGGAAEARRAPPRISDPSLLRRRGAFDDRTLAGGHLLRRLVGNVGRELRLEFVLSNVEILASAGQLHRSPRSARDMPRCIALMTQLFERRDHGWSRPMSEIRSRRRPRRQVATSVRVRSRHPARRRRPRRRCLGRTVASTSPSPPPIQVIPVSNLRRRRLAIRADRLSSALLQFWTPRADFGVPTAARTYRVSIRDRVSRLKFRSEGV